MALSPAGCPAHGLFTGIDVDASLCAIDGVCCGCLWHLLSVRYDSIDCCAMPYGHVFTLGHNTPGREVWLRRWIHNAGGDQSSAGSRSGADFEIWIEMATTFRIHQMSLKLDLIDE